MFSYKNKTESFIKNDKVMIIYVLEVLVDVTLIV